MKSSRKGQNTLEYALLIGLVSLALVAMNTLFKRQVQGVVKSSADQLGQEAQNDYFNVTGQKATAQALGSAAPELLKYDTTQPYSIYDSKNERVVVAPNGGRDRYINLDFTQGGGTWKATYLDTSNDVKGIPQDGTPKKE